jgi:hypothetical protein
MSISTLSSFFVFDESRQALEPTRQPLDRQVTIIDRADDPVDHEAGIQVEDRRKVELPLSPIPNSVVSPTQR